MQFYNHLEQTFEQSAVLVQRLFTLSHRATIHVYFHRFTCRFKSLLMYIEERIKAFAYAFYYWNFQYSSPIHYLTWNRLSCSFGNIEERGQRKLYKTARHEVIYARLRLGGKKKTSLFFFFLVSMGAHNNAHPRKNLFKRDGEILRSINRLFPDKTLQVSLVNPSFRLK